jgi:hypothetical protein
MRLSVYMYSMVIYVYGYVCVCVCNSGSARALIYNDQSVLENHHANTMFSILQQPECNIFAHMKREQRQELRTIMIKAILATDMSFHFDEIKKMDAVEAKKAATVTPGAGPAKAMPLATSNDKKAPDVPSTSLPPSSSFSPTSTADRQFVVNMLIHTSDLSGQGTPIAGPSFILASSLCDSYLYVM